MEERTMRFGPVDVQVGSTSFSVAPGGSITIPIRLLNRTTRDEYFEITVRGIPNTWVLMDMPVLYLAPGEVRESTVTITPPAALGPTAGLTPVVIRAASQADPALAGETGFDLHIGAGSVIGPTVASPVGATMASPTAATTVTAAPGFHSDLGPRQVEANQTVRLRIHNPGAYPETYSVYWQSPEDRLGFTPNIVSPIQVMPGDTVAVDTVLRPAGSNWVGSAKLLPYSVVVRSGTGEVQSHTGEVVTRPLLPVWALPVLLVFCLTALCGVGYLLNIWNPARADSAVQTADVQAVLDAAATATISYNQTAAALTGQADDDGDGLTNAQEAELGSIPQSADSDNDRLLDGDEVRLGTNLMNPDTDGDGILDGLDLDPRDAANPALTATFAAAIPTLTLTPESTPTLLVPTDTLAPTEIPTAAPTATSTNTPVPTATLQPLPITGGSRIVFESDREGDLELYLFNATDASLIRLTNSPGIDSQPAWSPDGARIAFSSARDGNSEIYVMNADGSGLANISNNPAEDSFPAWSPDGGSIVFQTNRDGNNEIYVMRADGSNQANVTNNPANDYAPAWYESRSLLSTQNRILFSTDRDGNSEIYAMQPDGSEPANLTNNPAGDAYPAVLPAGGAIAFVTDRDGNGEIYTMETNGNNPTNRTNHAANDSLPAWSPDGRWIAFVTDRDGNPEVYVIPSEGGNAANLSRSGGQDLYPAWK